MKVIDLGHPLIDGMAVFPGDIVPSIKSGATMEDNGWRTTIVNMSSHAGTHMDAPAHMLKDGEYMDELPNETFFGFGLVIDVRHCAGRKIELSDIKAHVKDVNFSDFLLFYTGWSDKWGTEEYMKDFPTLSEEAAKWVTKQDLKGIGFDALSVDTVDSTTCEIHKTILGAKLVILENLTNLDKVGKKPFCMTALPISLVKQDGGSARVMAVLE
ncbi:MAG: cyclase family protein [Synergistaceae bacterium]